MERRFKNAMVCWLIASVLHIPFPVWDGDNVGTVVACDVAGRIIAYSDSASYCDLAFVFLGCDQPDDSDDGPVDADPEHGFGPFGTFPMLCHDKHSRVADTDVSRDQNSRYLASSLPSTLILNRPTRDSGMFSLPCHADRSGHRHPIVIRC